MEADASTKMVAQQEEDDDFDAMLDDCAAEL